MKKMFYKLIQNLVYQRRNQVFDKNLVSYRPTTHAIQAVRLWVKVKFFAAFLLRHWIIAIFLALVANTVYINTSMLGADPTPTPTPDLIKTVPQTTRTPRPTKTPLPTPTPFNATPLPPTVAAPGAPGAEATNAPSDAPADDDNARPTTDTGNADNGNSSPNSGEPVDDNAETVTNPDGQHSQTTGFPGTLQLLGVVTTPQLNVRAEPAITAVVIDRLTAGAVVTISQRDPRGAWWYICCGAQTQKPGWVSAAFIRLHSDATNGLGLAAVGQAGGVAPITTTVTTTSPISVTEVLTSRGAPAVELTLAANPAYVWAGQAVDFQFTVVNTGAQELTKLQLRDDLPPGLLFLGATLGGNGRMEQTSDAADGPILTIVWPTLAVGAQVTATVTLQVAPTTPADAILDNLAQIQSQEGAEGLAGLTLAMPPTLAPQFR